MAAFPILSKPPSYPLDPDGDLDDSAIRSPFTAGYEQTRPAFTRSRRSWGVNYKSMPQADMDTLRDFERVTLVNGADSFTWTHPLSGATYTVRLAAPIKFARSRRGPIGDASFMLREV